MRERAEGPIETTLHLARIIEGCLPRPKPGQSHPATRTFQALRIAVNDEYGALYEGLLAAERALKPGGLLAVVTLPLGRGPDGEALPADARRADRPRQPLRSR